MLDEKLAAAISNKKNDVNSFIWKGKKEDNGNGVYVQKETRLMDATPEQLREFYNYCDVMLNNPDKEKPGRYVLLDILKDQRVRCNAELFLRWLETERSLPKFKFLGALREFLDLNKKEIEDPSQFPISGAVGQCPEEFDDIPTSIILEGCLDKLGKFNKQHITLTFILKQGLWFTPEESKDLTVKDASGAIKDRLEVVRERLNLKPSNKLYVTPKGLSFRELRSMIGLKSKKYSELTSDQLRTLRNRILFSLEDEVLFHITQWEERQRQIELVCEKRGITL